MPSELLLQIPADPEQMKLVNRRFHGVYSEPAAAAAFARHITDVRVPQQFVRALGQLEANVARHLQPGSLAALCQRLEFSPEADRVQSFELLLPAVRACVRKDEPMIELFRQTNQWSAAQRTACQAMLMDVDGAPGARAVANAECVIGGEEVPGFVASLESLTQAQRSRALGALADQLFGLPYLQSHDFVRICMDFHHLPWPPAAAAGLLRKIGWIPPEAMASLTQRAAGIAPLS